jgi:multisubunit Na+/H+ antiporter MnhG subunit
MVRMLTQFVVNLVCSVLAFLVAKWLIPGFHLEWSGFFIAVGVFTVAQTVLGPFVFNQARQHASAILGGIGIVSTLLSLIIASLFPGGLTIDGVSTWFVAAFVVWVITALGGWILLALLAKRAKNRNDAKEEEQLIEKISKKTDERGKGSAA